MFLFLNVYCLLTPFVQRQKANDVAVESDVHNVALMIDKYVWNPDLQDGGLQDGEVLVYDSTQGGIMPAGTLIEDVIKG